MNSCLVALSDFFNFHYFCLRVEYLVLKADVIKFVSISLNKFQIQWKSAYLFDAKNAIFRPIP